MTVLVPRHFAHVHLQLKIVQENNIMAFGNEHVDCVTPNKAEATGN